MREHQTGAGSQLAASGRRDLEQLACGSKQLLCAKVQCLALKIGTRSARRRVLAAQADSRTLEADCSFAHACEADALHPRHEGVVVYRSQKYGLS